MTGPDSPRVRKPPQPNRISHRHIPCLMIITDQTVPITLCDVGTTLAQHRFQPVSVYYVFILGFVYGTAPRSAAVIVISDFSSGHFFLFRYIRRSDHLIISAWSTLRAHSNSLSPSLDNNISHTVISAVQFQKAVSAHFTSKQILPFDFVEHIFSSGESWGGGGGACSSVTNQVNCKKTALTSVIKMTIMW